MFDFRTITRQAITAALAEAKAKGISLYAAEQVAELAIKHIPADAAASYKDKFGETMHRTLCKTAALGW